MAFTVLATLKLVLLLASGISHQIAMTPPNPPAKKIVKPNFFEKYVHSIVRIVIYPFWIAVLLDIGATVWVAGGGLASELPYLDSILFPSGVDAHVLQHPSATFIVGAALLIVSAKCRTLCFKTLGDQFRFEVSIQARHKLVTSGPYSFVRHPSYLALYGDYVGSVAVLVSRGSYFRECVLLPLLRAMACATFPASQRCEEAASGVGIFHFAAMTAFVVWVGDLLFIERQLAGRLSWEDDVLHKEFGKEWELYAERVRWRILPGIL